MFCTLPSVKVPVAVNCCVVPSATEGMAGVTAIETTVAGVTVNTVFADTEPETALMVLEPVDTLVARPWLPDALLTVATRVAEDDQVTEVVRFCVLPSLKVPVAVIGSVVPSAIEGFASVIASETSAGGPTVSVVEPLIEFSVAVMVDEPTATLCAKPCVGALLLMVALAVDEELHITCMVMFAVLPSA